MVEVSISPVGLGASVGGGTRAEGGTKAGGGKKAGIATRRAGSLASARDRARLRAAQAAERRRVEAVLARGPREGDGGRAPVWARRQASEEQLALAETARCRVCGAAAVDGDFVNASGPIFVGRCTRCDHRWTERVSRSFTPRLARGERCLGVGAA